MERKRRPPKIKWNKNGRRGEYAWNGLIIIRHPDDKKFWAVKINYLNFLPGKFKTLDECCEAIDHWHRVRNKTHLRLVV